MSVVGFWNQGVWGSGTFKELGLLLLFLEYVFDEELRLNGSFVYMRVLLGLVSLGSS